MDEIKILRCSECFQNRGLKLATIMPNKNLDLLDLGAILFEENVAEFESLDMAVHMLFRAGKHS